MIVEYIYSEKEMKRKCYGCKWLELDENKYYGQCKCPYNKVKERTRFITDKRCSWKNADQTKMDL